MITNHTYSGFGGSLASSVPSFRARSFGSSGSESESELSIGSSGLTGCAWWWLLLLLLPMPTPTPTPPLLLLLLPFGAAMAMGLPLLLLLPPPPPPPPPLDCWDCCRLFRGGASGCACCDCWETPNSFSCAANMSKSYAWVGIGFVCVCMGVCVSACWSFFFGFVCACPNVGVMERLGCGGGGGGRDVGARGGWTDKSEPIRNL